MKVAILTYARTNNYGATLQCYALDKYIKSLGHETIILNVPLDDGSCRKLTRPLYKRVLGLAKRIVVKMIRLVMPAKNSMKDYEIRYSLTREQRVQEQAYSNQNMLLFDEFRQKYMPNLSIEYFTLQELIDNYPDADAFIVGSDQVWNVKICTHQYPIFFLEFVKKNHKRISYAACMGGDSNYMFVGKTKEHVKELLSKFDHIAVRNEMAVNICRNNFNFTPQQVLDPTFLIDNYDELLAETKQDAKGSLYVDKFIINDPWMKSIREIAKQKNLSIRMDNCLIEIPGVPFTPLCTVQDWLGILKTADLIFTDSFHCSVFCILFKKQFVVAPSYQGGEGRMIDLLKKFCIEDRFYRTPKDLIDNIDVWSKPIDYDKVYAKMEILRKESRIYLKEALK